MKLDARQHAAYDANDPFAADLDALRGVRIELWHHSIGRDILEGLEEILRMHPPECAPDLGGGPVGENGDPMSKIGEFEERATNGAADIVALKLCYADFTPDTNVDVLLRAYREAVARLRVARPGIVVMHVTPPLHVRQMDLRARMQRKLKRPVWEDECNLRRLEFAERLAALFPDDPIFDLARVESTKPDGTREMFVIDGRQVPMLWSGYTLDGGHLNAAGKRAASRAFLKALVHAANVARSAATSTSGGYAHTHAPAMRELLALLE